MQFQFNSTTAHFKIQRGEIYSRSPAVKVEDLNLSAPAWCLLCTTAAAGEVAVVVVNPARGCDSMKLRQR